MKKVFATISIIIVMSVLCISLVACSNNVRTEGQLANLLNDHNHEQFEYLVEALDENNNALDGYYAQTGSYKVTLDAYANGATVENFGNATLENVKKGVLVRCELNYGETKYQTGCYFALISGTGYMVPAYTFRVESKNDVEQFRLQGVYDGATLNYERWINGEKSTGSVSAKGTYYDNNEFHQSLRTITTFSTNFSFSFAVPVVSARETSVPTLRATISKEVNVKTQFTENNETYKEDGILCYKMFLTRNAEVVNASQVIYFAKDAISSNGWDLKHVIVQFEEPFKLDGKYCKMVYTLQTASLS